MEYLSRRLDTSVAVQHADVMQTSPAAARARRVLLQTAAALGVLTHLAVAADPVRLLKPAPRESVSEAARSATVRSPIQLGPPRLVLVNQAALNAVEVEIELEPGQAVIYTLGMPLTRSADGRVGWAGNERSGHGITVMSSQADGTFHANIRYDGMVYRVERVEGEVYGVFKMDVSRLPFGEGSSGPVPVPPPPRASSR